MIPSLYIHIPFCKRKCNYCDFVSYAGKEEMIEGYVETLTQELKEKTSKFIPPLPVPRRSSGQVGEGLAALQTIYFGGGTPTLLRPDHFAKILFESRISNLESLEITVEANPGTVNKDYLKELRQLGINRLSLGAQTFNDRHLKTLGRIHSSKDIYQAVEDARTAGLQNISLDLIFALPDQTLEEWKEDLSQAINLEPNHLSTYNLQIEEGTPFAKMTNAELQMPNEEIEAEMYEHTIETLTAKGYHHYEISNFAQPGRECRHNINYWKNGNYIGIGAGAHSHVNGRRWANPDPVEEYVKNSLNGFETRTELRASSIVTTIKTDKRETLFLGLRLIEGLPTKTFEGFENEVSELLNDGLLIRQNGNYKLSKRGLFLANLVFEKFV